MTAGNRHGTAILLGDRGLLITGRSGAGKSTLALALVRSWLARGSFAAMVADDQVLLLACGGRLVCRAPEPIAGLAEVFGLGPRPVRHEPRCVVFLVAELVAGPVPRLAEDASVSIAGTTLPRLLVAERDAQAAASAIDSAFGVPPFLPAPIMSS